MNPPDAEAARDSAGAPWRRPQLGTSGLERYLHTLRERLRLIAAVTLATTLVAALYLAVADDKYRAEADLLVSPASQNDTALTGLPVIHESSDPTRDVSTAARLVTSRDVAARVQRELGLDESVSELLGAVSAEPVAQSNIVSVRAEANVAASSPRTSPTASRRRWWPSVLRSCAGRSTSRLPRIRQQIAAAADARRRTRRSSAGSSSGFESLRATGDPTLRVETRAQPPPSALCAASRSHHRGGDPRRASSSVWAAPSR